MTDGAEVEFAPLSDEESDEKCREHCSFAHANESTHGDPGQNGSDGDESPVDDLFHGAKFHVGKFLHQRRDNAFTSDESDVGEYLNKNSDRHQNGGHNNPDPGHKIIVSLRPGG